MGFLHPPCTLLDARSSAISLTAEARLNSTRGACRIAPPGQQAVELTPFTEGGVATGRPDEPQLVDHVIKTGAGFHKETREKLEVRQYLRGYYELLPSTIPGNPELTFEFQQRQFLTQAIIQNPLQCNPFARQPEKIGPDKRIRTADCGFSVRPRPFPQLPHLALNSSLAYVSPSLGCICWVCLFGVFLLGMVTA